MAGYTGFVMNVKLLSTEELSKYLGVVKGTVRRYVNNGMPAYRIGLGYRYDINEVLNWLKRNKRVNIRGSV